MLCRPAHSFDQKKSRVLFLVLIEFKKKKQNITAFFSAQTSEDPSLCKYIFLRQEKKKEKKATRTPLSPSQLLFLLVGINQDFKSS